MITLFKKHRLLRYATETFHCPPNLNEALYAELSTELCEFLEGIYLEGKYDEKR